MAEGECSQYLERMSSFSQPQQITKPRLSNKGLIISYEDLGALCFATKHIPEHTPKKWDKFLVLFQIIHRVRKGKRHLEFY